MVRSPEKRRIRPSRYSFSMGKGMGTDPKAGMLEPGKGSRGLDHFGFQVKDMEETVKGLKGKGAIISAGPNVTPAGVKYAFVDGPEGIRIELVERG